MPKVPDRTTIRASLYKFAGLGRQNRTKGLLLERLAGKLKSLGAPKGIRGRSICAICQPTSLSQFGEISILENSEVRWHMHSRRLIQSKVPTIERSVGKLSTFGNYR